ncbi:MAG: L-asparaginase [Chloroflexota bacterium]|jgi:L-asparaginase|nr:L-asparaginase [Chloroflexota bacterium]
MSRVAVVFTGGTIAMRVDPRTGAAVPSLHGTDILARTPGIEQIADVEAIDWGLVPASHLSFPQILELARTVLAALERPEIDGAVLVQGTDTIEETAFALDLTAGALSDKPIVVVGAMRNADSPEYDGPQNLRDAVRVAATFEARELGALVAMNGAILPADDATKTHTDDLGAFRALNLGGVGEVREGVVRITGHRDGRRRLPRVPEAAGEPVWLVTAGVAMDGSLIRLATGFDARGIVVAATGAGNTSPDILAAATEAIGRGIPVAVTTRSPAGRASGAYGFPGGGATWLAAGAMPTGFLGGPKARVALALGLGCGLDDEGLRALLAGRERSA